MTALREREIARRLAAGPAPKPPADLLGRLQADIPENLELHPELQGGQPRRIERRLYWLSAASLAIAVTGGIIALQTMKEPMITDREGIRAGSWAGSREGSREGSPEESPEESLEESTVQARQEAEAAAPLELRAEAAAQEEPEPDRQPVQGDSTDRRGKRKAADLVQPDFAERSSPTAARAQAAPEERPPSAVFEAHEATEREADQPAREIPKPESSLSAQPQVAPTQAATAPSVTDAGSDLTLSVPSLPPGGLPSPPAAKRSRPAAKKISEADSPASAQVAEPDAPARFAAAGIAPGEGKAGSTATQKALLQGTVVAEDGSPLPGVTVTVEQSEGVSQRAVTDEHGGFLLPSLPLGYAEIRFELAGSKEVVLPVTLVAGRQHLDRITLLPATVSE